MTGPRRARRPERVGPSVSSDAISPRILAVLEELADSALEGAGPIELTGVFAELMGRRVILLDPGFQPRAQAGDDDAKPLAWDRSDPSVDRVLTVLAAQRRPLRIPSIPGSLLDQACLVAPIVVRRDSLGYLLVFDDGAAAEPDDAEFLTVTYAATLFALTLAHERTDVELNLRYRRTMLDALVSGMFRDARDAEQQARSLGIADGRLFRVAVLRPEPTEVGDGTAPAEAADALANRVLSGVPGAVAAARQDCVVAVVPEAASGTADRGHGPGSAIDALDGLASCTCGVSEAVLRPDRAPEALRQAEQAVELGLLLGRTGQVIRYDELGVYRLLLTIGDARQLHGFSDDVLGPLVDYSSRHSVDLVHTLSVYLHNHGSLKQSARALGVHANTIAYRVQRIQEITGLDLGDPDDRLLAHVTVKIIESQG